MTRLLGLVAVAACWTTSAPPPVPAPAVRTPVQEIVIRDAPSPFSLNLDARYMFWIGGEDGDEGIWRADKRPGARPVRLAKTTDARGLTLDGDRVWWGDGSAVRWVAKTGGEPTTLLSGLPVTVWDITRDEHDVVVASYDPRNERTKLTRYAIADGQERKTIELPGQVPIMLAQPEGLYVGTDLGLVRIKRDGTIEEVSEGDVDVQTLFFERDAVLFGSYGQVHRARRDGGVSVEIASGFGVVTDVAADDRFVYWGSSFSEPPGSAIYRVPKAGGKPRVVSRLEGAPSSVIVDGEHLYWCDTEQGLIVRRLRRVVE